MRFAYVCVIAVVLGAQQAFASDPAVFPDEPNVPDDYEVSSEVEIGIGGDVGPYATGTMLQYGTSGIKCEFQQVTAYYNGAGTFVIVTATLPAPSVKVSEVGQNTGSGGTGLGTASAFAVSAEVEGPTVVSAGKDLGTSVPEVLRLYGQIDIKCKVRCWLKAFGRPPGPKTRWKAVPVLYSPAV